MKVELTVNGTLHTLQVPPLRRLIEILRNDLKLMGTKEGCGEGECGACAVLVDGELTTACLIPALQAAGSEVLTIEGLDAGTDRLQQIFIEEGAVHCGFCTPGMILAARALLEKNEMPCEEEIRIALSGNICRCTGYEKIHNAVRRAAQEGYASSIQPRPNLCSDCCAEFSPAEASNFFIPSSLKEALVTLNKNPDLYLLAGGTDTGPDLKSGKLDIGQAMSILRLPELLGIEQKGEWIRIGACTSNAEIIRDATARKHLPALVFAASHSGAPAIQNRATVGGNIVTASGAGDLPVILHALGARVLIAEAQGNRELSLEEFMLGYRKTALKPGEILKDILIPVPAPGSVQKFYKRGSRKGLTLSRASLAFFLHCENGRIKTFRAAAGSMSPIPHRLHSMENQLTGQSISQLTSAQAAQFAQDAVNPRKSPEYRKSITYNLTRRFFDEVKNNL